jgi:hypothetical protein
MGSWEGSGKTPAAKSLYIVHTVYAYMPCVLCRGEGSGKTPAAKSIYR